MNAEQKNRKQKHKPRVPLYKSPWLALFLVLRHEWLSLRPSDKLS